MGFLGYSPQVFSVLEPYEALDIMDRAKDRMKLDHELQYIANLNAIGAALNKNHKYFNAFKEEPKKKQVTDEEREEMRKFLENW